MIKNKLLRAAVFQFLSQISKAPEPQRDNTNNFTSRCTRMSLMWASFRLPCKPIHLFTPIWQQSGSIEASVYLSCSGCVGQQVSEGTDLALLLCQHFRFSAVHMNVKWLRPICSRIWGFAHVCVCVWRVWQRISKFPWLLLDWQSDNCTRWVD